MQGFICSVFSGIECGGCWLWFEGSLRQALGIELWDFKLRAVEYTSYNLNSSYPQL